MPVSRVIVSVKLLLWPLHRMLMPGLKLHNPEVMTWAWGGSSPHPHSVILLAFICLQYVECASKNVANYMDQQWLPARCVSAVAQLFRFWSFAKVIQIRGQTQRSICTKEHFQMLISIMRSLIIWTGPYYCFRPKPRGRFRSARSSYSS